MLIKALDTGISLHRGPIGEPVGYSLPGAFETKSLYIWIPYLDPEDIKILSLGPSGILEKGQGFPELLSDHGV